MNKIKICACIILVVAIFSCSARTKWPKEMPAKTTITYVDEVGMSGYLNKIEFKNDSLLYFEESHINGIKPFFWSAKIEKSEKEKLYQAFVENKIDVIKNKENKEITYDAGTETISIELYDSISYSVTYGANFPLSEANLKRYKTIVDAIHDLVKKYKLKQKKQNITDSTIAVIPYDSANHSWIFQEKGKITDLSENEINEIKTIIEKAVREENAKRSHYGVMELTKYKFQYIPVITKSGEKQVWVNAFCTSHGIDWSKDIIGVDDGGNCYWNMTVNLTKKTYYNFSVNGVG